MARSQVILIRTATFARSLTTVYKINDCAIYFTGEFELHPDG